MRNFTQTKAIISSLIVMLICCFTYSGFAQTNPTPQSLPYTQNFGTTTFSTMPTGTISWSGLSGASVSTLALAQSSVPTADATVTATSSTGTTGGTFGYATASNGKLYIQTSSSTTSGVNQLAFAINTGAATAVTVGYDITVLTQGSASTAITGTVLQYRAGTSGAWTTVTGSNFSYINSANSSNGGDADANGDVDAYSFTVTGLSAGTDYQFRFAHWRPSGSCPGIGYDNISVTAGYSGGGNIGTPGVNFVGRINAYTQPNNCAGGDYRVLNYRRLSATTGTPTDGRGQWVTTVNVQASGGDVTADNMPGGGGAGFLFTNGGTCGSAGQYTNKWTFGSTTQAGLDAVNLTTYNGSTDMGINMGTAGRYTFVMKDVTNTNGPAFYVGYTTNAPVSITHNTGTQQSLAASSATITATISATPSSQEKFYLRYRGTTNDLSTSTSQVLGSVSGTTITFSLSGLTANTAYYYYVLNTTQASYTTLSEVDKSLSVLTYADNAGSNYTFTTPNPVTYTWGGGSGSWLTPANWTPNTSLAGPTNGDAVIFNTAGTNSVTSVPTATLTSLTVSAGTVTLAPASGANATLTLTNAGTALSVASSTTLNIIGITTNSRTLTLAYSGSGNTVTIAGTLNLQTSGTGAGNYTATNSTTTVNGLMTVSNVTSVITSTSSNLLISATGTFQMLVAAAVIPAAAWTAGSPGATLQLSQSSAATVTGLNGVTFQNLTVDGSNTLTLNATASVVSFTVARNYTQTSGTSAIDFASSSATTNVSIGGNFQKTVGTMNTSGSASNGTITFTGTAASLQCNSSQWTNFVVAASAVCTLNGAFVTNSNSSATSPTSFTVNANGTLNCSTFVLSGSTTAASNSFVLITGGTLGIGSAVGITTTGNATGNIQTVIRNFPAGGNYTYNGTTNQTATGNALPSSLTGILKIDNTGTSPNNVVTLSQATSTSGTLSLTNGTLNLNALTLTLSSNAAQSIAGSGSNTFNITGAAGSTLALSAPATSHVVTLSNFGTGTSANLITGATVNVQLNSNTQLDCGGNGTSTSMLTVLGTLTMNSATSSNIANVHPPFYGAASTLVYNANYGRFSEWSATSGPGYPNNVTISGNSTFTTSGTNLYAKANGNLTVNSGSTFSFTGITNNGTNVGVEFVGNIVNDGTITLNTGSTSQRLKALNLTNGNSNTTAVVSLSGTVGGDLELTGNYVDNAIFNANARAVFFTGTGVQDISGTASAPFNIDYIVSSKSAGSIRLLVDLLTEGPNSGNAITLSSATDIFDLNGRSFTIGKAGVASTISGSGLFKGSAASSLTILGTGAFGTIRFDQTTNPTTNGVGVLTINRTTSGSVTLGSTFNVLTSATFTDGVLDVNGNTFRLGGIVARTNGTLTVATGTTTFNGGSAQSIPASLYTSNAAANIVISNAAGVTFNGSVAVSGNLTVNANSLFIPAAAVIISGSGALVGNNSTNSVAQVTRATGTSDFSGQYTLTRTVTNLTIEYAGAAAQGITTTNTFGGLKISNTSGVNMGTSVTVNNGLNLNAGNLSIGNNTLTLNGAVSRTSGNLAGSIISNLVANSTTGSLFFDGTGNNNYLKSFTIGASGVATLGNALNITAWDGTTNLDSTGVLTVTTGGTLATGGFLTMKSDINGTARIAANTSGSTYITGDVSVERYIRLNPNKAWRLLASNTSGQSINAAWQEGQANSLSNTSPGFGIQVSAGNTITTNLTSAQTAGFDTLSAGVSLFKYNPATDGLESVTNTITTGIASLPGYFIFIRGDRRVGGYGGVATPTAATVLRSKGTLFQGPQTTTTGAQNYALARNPFASRIDMRTITVQSNVVDAFQVWDPKLGGVYGVGAYQTFNRSGANYIVTPGNGSYGSNGSIQNYIESGTAFFINSVSNVSNNSIIIPEGAKTSSSSNVTFRPSTPVANEGRIAFSLYAVNPTSTDVVDGGLAFFNNEYSNAVDINDVRKNGNFAENFGLVRNNIQLVVEKRQQVNMNDTLFFSMSQMRQLTYRLDIEATDIDPLITTAILEDRFTNTNTTLDLAVPNSYDFTVDASAASRAADRFRIVFRQSSVVPVSFVSVKAAQSGNNISVEWKVANEINTIRYEVEKSTDGRSFTKKGTVSAAGLSTYNWLDENVAAGYNYYRIKSVDNSGLVKYTQIVKVQFGGKAGISVSPNPIQGNFVNIQFNNQQAGKYGVRITNIAGQAVYNRQVQHNGGSSSQSFVLPSALITGVYQLEVIAPDNSTHTEKLIINQGN